MLKNQVQKNTSKPSNRSNRLDDSCRFRGFGCTVVNKELMGNHERLCPYDPQKANYIYCDGCELIIQRDHDCTRELDNRMQWMNHRIRQLAEQQEPKEVIGGWILLSFLLGLLLAWVIRSLI